MNLERRAFLTVLLALVLATTASFAVAQLLVSQSVANLESEAASRDLSRASRAITEDVAILDRIASDWAHWDDAVRFVQGTDPAFAATNFGNGTYLANRLSLMAFYDAAGRLVYADAFDLARSEPAPVPATFATGTVPPALVPPRQDRSVSGLLLVDGMPYMVSSWDILHSDATGPPAGVLVWGRVLDAPAVEALRTHTLVDLQVSPWSSISKDPAYAALADSPTASVLQAISSRTLAVTGRLDDVAGHPALAIQVRMDRPIYQQGVQNLAYGMSSTILVGGGILVIITFILDRSVFTPLSRLRRDIEAVSLADEGRRLELGRDDEIGQLAGAFNRMLERIDSNKGELERSNRDLREFAAVVSHDLQPPLSTIALNAAVVRERERGKLEADAMQRLDRLESTALRMAQHIRSILDYSRVSYQEAPMAEVNMNAVIEDVINDLEERLHATGGRIEYRSLPSLEGNRTQLQQLLQNLMGNALKYHVPGVAPVVRVHAQPHADGQGWQGWRIVVEDNGMGFHAEDLASLLRPYTRLEHRIEGHGLGLATCHKIVERHHGRLTAESSPGKGARFFVDLPVRQPMGNAAPEPVAA